MRFTATPLFNAAFDLGKAGCPIIIDGRRYSQYTDGWKPGIPLKPSILTSINVDAINERMAAEAVYAALNKSDRPNGATEPSLSIGDIVIIHSADADIPFAVRPYGFEAVDMFQVDEDIVRH